MPKKRINKKNKDLGRIISFFAGVARVEGLPHVFPHEILTDIEGKPAAIVIGFDNRGVEALFFNERFDPAQPVAASGRKFTILLDDSLIGRVLDGLGRPLDGLGGVRGEEAPIFREAPPIIDREPVAIPLSTGIKIIDTNLPLGRGQRELIIGDRKLGKSALAVDTVLHQKYAEPKVYCVYVLCGQKEEKLREIISLFDRHNAFLYTTVVASTAGASFARQYLAPFVGCAIGEYFRDRGQDALIVYDDFSKHAKAYRDISLLLERAPGREAYPGDIFSLHAGLLERAAKMSPEKGGGSLSALPIIETQEGDITSFIPTNLISITDGQIYLERGLFQKGFIPAVNVGLSVSRVGSQAQPKILQQVVSGIRLALAQHKELQKLSQLETVVSAEAQKKIHRGELMLELLKQEKHFEVTWPQQVVLFYAVEEGLFDDVEKDNWSHLEKLLLELVKNRYFKVLDRIKSGIFDDKAKKKIREIAGDFKKEFIEG